MASGQKYIYSTVGTADRRYGRKKSIRSRLPFASRHRSCEPETDNDDGEYTDGDVHVNTCESHGSSVRCDSRSHRHLRQVDAVSLSVSAPTRTILKTGTRHTQSRCPSHALKSTICYTRALLRTLPPRACLHFHGWYPRTIFGTVRSASSGIFSVNWQR